MAEQIRRNGAWIGDLARPTLARVFFELPDGTYHAGMSVVSLDDALRLVVEYGLSVPRAFVILNDEVILDVKDGILDFPNDAQSLFDGAKGAFLPWNTDWLEADSLARWTRSRCAKLVNAAQAYAEASSFDGSTPNRYDHPVNRLEHELQSVAAEFGLDLSRFGYRPPGVVCAELQRFDFDSLGVPTTSRRSTEACLDPDELNRSVSQWDRGDGIQDITPPVQNGRRITVSHQTRQPDPFDTLADIVKDAVWKPRIARIWWVAIAVYWPLAAFLVGFGIVEINLLLMVVGMVLSPLTLLITLMAWALAPEQPISSWRRDAWNGELDRELNPHVTEDGRIPRSMDPSDPASGSFWIGNHARQQVLRDRVDRRER